MNYSQKKLELGGVWCLLSAIAIFDSGHGIVVVCPHANRISSGMIRGYHLAGHEDVRPLGLSQIKE
jgi:hypothetical protein